MRNQFDSKELEDFFYWTGCTLIASQAFEYGLKFILYLLSHKNIIKFSLKDATNIIEDRKIKTIGEVFKILQKDIDFGEDVYSKIEVTIKKRNYFVHNMLNDKIREIADISTRNDVINEIKEIRFQLVESDKILQDIIDRLLKLYNIDMNKLTEKLQNEIALIKKIED